MSTASDPQAGAEPSLPSQLGSSNVPVLPAGTDELLRLLREPDLHLEELAEALTRFPSIVARLMALANSPWSSPLSPVTSLPQATSRLGIGVVRSVSMALTVAAPFQPHRCPEFDAERFWCCSLLTAEAASLIAQVATDGNGAVMAEARTAGLLRNLGLLWMADRLPETTGAALLAAESTAGLGVDTALYDACGIGHRAAAEYLGKSWNLPARVVDAMSTRGSRGNAGGVVGLPGIVGLADRMVSDLYRYPDEPFDALASRRFGIDLDTARAVHPSLVKQLPAMRALAKSLFLARRLAGS